MTAEEAAQLINDKDVVSLSGFTAAGVPKAVTLALSHRAEALHAEGKPFKISLITGASTGASTDGVLVKADAMSFRTPYQSSKELRASMNTYGGVEYVDAHLSHLAQEMRYGFWPKPDVLICEACDMDDEGNVVLTAAVGNVATFARYAKKVIIELNSDRSKRMRGMHDLYEPLDPPARREIPIYSVKDRIGSDVLKIDPAKIVGVVETNLPDEVGKFTEPDEVTARIGRNVSDFLAGEMKAGRIPSSFLPIQSGVGNIANAVLYELGANPDIPAFTMYTEVMQDAVIDLMRQGRISFGSGSALTVTAPVLKGICDDMDFFHDKILLRPQELSNHPEIIRRLGLITINTALEADIYGNINSTHVTGTRMMNGIGGSGDFTRNAYISIFTTPSTAKGGNISAIVSMVSHADHSEHSVKVLVTEHGVADLRGKGPRRRAEEIINNCVDPEYRPILRDYLKICREGHTPHNLSACFEMHRALIENGDMRTTDWSRYSK